MRALVAGQHDALNELMVLWEGSLLGFIFRYVQNEATARDLVQETFVRVYLHRERFRADSTFSAWIFTIAANLCRNQYRWFGRHPTVSLDELTADKATRHEKLVCPRCAPDLLAQKNERIEALQVAISELSHELRTTLLLFEYEGLSYREIASIVGCSEKGVESRLVRARVSLRRKLSRFFEAGQLEEPSLMPQRG